jgi:hypothetical protein
MRSKKNKETKKYALGGAIALGTGALQAGLGAYQMYQGQQLAKDIKEASTARPSEYAEMLKLSRQADLEQKRLEELNRTLATGIGAAQQAGGRAVVGALPAMVRAGDVGAQNILAQRQAAQLAALQMGAAGAEKEISREMAREQQQRMAAQAAVEGGLQNIAGAVGGIGKAAVLGSFGDGTKKGKETTSEGTLDQYLSSQPVAEISQETAIAPIIDEQGNLRAGSYMRAQEPVLKDIKGLMSEREALTGLTNEQYDALMRAKELGLVNFNAGGMMTGGKFSHKTNPIDIVQKGKKVGEMTGGEVILNPAQQKKLSQESAYFRSLLKKFNKKK